MTPETLNEPIQASIESLDRFYAEVYDALSAKKTSEGVKGSTEP